MIKRSTKFLKYLENVGLADVRAAGASQCHACATMETSHAVSGVQPRQFQHPILTERAVPTGLAMYSYNHSVSRRRGLCLSRTPSEWQFFGGRLMSPFIVASHFGNARAFSITVDRASSEPSNCRALCNDLPMPCYIANRSILQ
jgi:hypothetical protein